MLSPSRPVSALSPARPRVLLNPPPSPLTPLPAGQAFRLPGEAQKIDRVMEAFAGAYYHANPDPFYHQDACYLINQSINQSIN